MSGAQPRATKHNFSPLFQEIFKVVLRSRARPLVVIRGRARSCAVACGHKWRRAAIRAPSAECKNERFNNSLIARNRVKLHTITNPGSPPRNLVFHESFQSSQRNFSGRARPCMTAHGRLQSRASAYGFARHLSATAYGRAQPCMVARSIVWSYAASYGRAQPRMTSHGHVRLRATTYGRARLRMVARVCLWQPAVAYGRTPLRMVTHGHV